MPRKIVPLAPKPEETQPTAPDADLATLMAFDATNPATWPYDENDPSTWRMDEREFALVLESLRLTDWDADPRICERSKVDFLLMQGVDTLSSLRGRWRAGFPDMFEGSPAYDQLHAALQNLTAYRARRWPGTALPTGRYANETPPRPEAGHAVRWDTREEKAARIAARQDRWKAETHVN